MLSSKDEKSPNGFFLAKSWGLPARAAGTGAGIGTYTGAGGAATGFVVLTWVEVLADEFFTTYLGAGFEAFEAFEAFEVFEVLLAWDKLEGFIEATGLD